MEGVTYTGGLPVRQTFPSVTAERSAPATELGDGVELRGGCPVCHGQSGSLLGKLNFAFVEGTQLPSRLNVVSCCGCGFVKCDSPAGQDRYDEFYAGYRYSPAYLAREVTPQESRYFDGLLEAIQPYDRGQENALFDIGCGSGNFLKHCRRRQIDGLHGIDLSRTCVENLHAAGFRAEVGSLSQIPFADQQPTTVVLSHVLEHVVDLPAALRQLSCRLAPGGAVYVEVPDSELFAEYNPQAPLRFFYPQHVVHFDQVHLRNLFHSRGFRISEMTRRCRFENELTIPAVAAVFTAGDSGGGAISQDFRLAATVRRWFETSSCDPSHVFAELAQRGGRVFVWGVGIHVQMLLGMTPLSDCQIVCCVDQDPLLHGKTIAGRRIDSTARLREATASDTVVIGSVIHRQQMARILREEFGFQGSVVTV